MPNTIVICTNNLVPPPLLRKVLTNAFVQADMVGDTHVVVVSHYPVFVKHRVVDDNEVFKKQVHKEFADVLIKTPIFNPGIFTSSYENIVVGESEYCETTIYNQLLLGAKTKPGNNVIIMEHDVLYPLNYLKLVSGVLESGIAACYWANGKFFSELGFFDVKHVMTLSRFSLRYETFCSVFENKIEKKLKFVEPVLKGISLDDRLSEESIINCFAMIHGEDTLDIRHGLNVSGSYLVEEYKEGHSYWGKADEIRDLTEGTYREFVERHPFYSYGIWS